ncbi:hypothetical protein V8E53_014322 [Lactarius tabidus]
MKSRTSTLWVVVFDASRNELGFGRRFNVDITDATYVSDLKTTVKGIIGDRLSRVLASELDIWRCKDRTTLFVDDVEDVSIGTRILTKVPEEFEYFLVIAKTRTLTFHDVELNDIAYANENAVPGFVKAHEEMLSKKRIASDEMRQAAECWVGEAASKQYFGDPHSTSEPPWTTFFDLPESSTIGQIECNHFGFVSAAYNVRSWSHFRDQSKRLFKEEEANCLFFYPLRHYFSSVSSSVTVKMGQDPWPFQLVMKVGEALEEESDSSKDMGHFTYRPRSDFLILNSTFPRVAVEVNSHSPGRPPADRYRMVIQGASVVRYANTYLDAYKDERNFIFMIIFIDGTGEVNRDLLYRTETSNTVYRKEKSFTLAKKKDRIEFLLELYNISSVLQNEADIGDTEKKVTKLGEDVRRLGFEAFTGKTNLKRPARDDEPGPSVRRRGGGGGGIEASRHTHDSDGAPNVIMMHAGSWELVSQISSHIRTVYDRRNRVLINSGGVYGYIQLGCGVFKDLAQDLARVAVGLVLGSTSNATTSSA